MKNPKELLGDCGLKDSGARDVMFKLIVEEIFRCSGDVGTKILASSNWDEFWEYQNNDLGNALGRLGHFYYFICKPFIEETGNAWKGQYNWEEDLIRDEIRLIGVASLIEKMMEKEEHADFFTWFEREHPVELKLNKISNYSSAKEKYRDIFGVNRKFKKYFETYLSKGDQETIKGGITIFSERSHQFEKTTNIAAVADFLYKLRSEFIHNAKLTHLCPPDIQRAAKFLGNKFYEVTLTMRDFLYIFQKSFSAYWYEKIRSVL